MKIYNDLQRGKESDENLSYENSQIKLSFLNSLSSKISHIILINTY